MLSINQYIGSSSLSGCGHFPSSCQQVEGKCRHPNSPQLYGGNQKRAISASQPSFPHPGSARVQMSPMPFIVLYVGKIPVSKGRRSVSEYIRRRSCAYYLPPRLASSLISVSVLAPCFNNSPINSVAPFKEHGLACEGPENLLKSPNLEYHFATGPDPQCGACGDQDRSA